MSAFSPMGPMRKRGCRSCLRRLRNFSRTPLLWAMRSMALPRRRANSSSGVGGSEFTRSYASPTAHRTSNVVDRLMRFLDRACFNGQYFHGTQESAEQRVRAWALLWNFCPSSPGTVRKYRGQACPAERWSENLVDETINRPHRRVQTRDTRYKADGSGQRHDDPATAYIRTDGSYVVRNNMTGDIVQVSDRNDPDWQSPF